MATTAQEVSQDRLDRMRALRVEAAELREEYQVVYRDRDIADDERLAALALLTKAIRAVLVEAQRLVYGTSGS